MVRLFFILLVLALNACSLGPQTLGLDNAAWQSMTDAQRQQAIRNYQKIQAHVRKSQSGDQDDKIKINLSSGWALMPPFDEYYRYQPVSFHLASGQCCSVTLSAKQASKQVPLLACYQNEGLYLDPGVWDKKDRPGTVYIPRSALWQWGQTYEQVTTGGIVRLLKARLYIEAQGSAKELPQPKVYQTN